MKHLKIKIYGKVQGVYYRATAVEKAKLHGVFGFTRNEPDGSVYIEVEGDEERLDKFVAWCYIGPARSVVESVIIEEGEIKNYQNFITVRIV
ncbi:MAG TPA: acylphosphatase [Bacteroidia bacterium]|jgi:acylphosphatase|nr:acylphosphatase [Bacteroidia bacterium]